MDDPTKAEILPLVALDETERAMGDERLSEDSKRRIARDMLPSLLLMARLSLKRGECLGFFASVIKSGEPWTETCEAEYRKASA